MQLWPYVVLFLALSFVSGLFGLGEMITNFAAPSDKFLAIGLLFLAIVFLVLAVMVILSALRRKPSESNK